MAFAATLNLADFDSNTDGFVIQEEKSSDFGSCFGSRVYNVSNAGDFNGDGLDDVVLGFSFSRDPFFESDAPGRSYVVLGAEEGYLEGVDLSDLNAEFSSPDITVL